MVRATFSSILGALALRSAPEKPRVLADHVGIPGLPPLRLGASGTRRHRRGVGGGKLRGEIRGPSACGWEFFYLRHPPSVSDETSAYRGRPVDTAQLLLLGFGAALALDNLLYAFVGCILGTVVGILPGLGPVSATAILIPLTFHLSKTGAIIMLAAICHPWRDVWGHHHQRPHQRPRGEPPRSSLASTVIRRCWSLVSQLPG
ncbi:MAG: tripartite tricarboxylate transporter permease [Desulfobacterales bacterium]|nr:tripartite tricarboxylate transporter permease [Desulfobacterales bacterium]